MKKKYLIFLLITIVALLSFFAYLNISREEKIAIPVEGGDVLVQNFIKNAKYTDNYITMIATNNKFDLYYDYSDYSFNIRLLEPDLTVSRPIAEKGLLDILNISKMDACKLNIYITVPEQIDATKSGINYGLSFCANSNSEQSNSQSAAAESSPLSVLTGSPLALAILIIIIFGIIIFISIKYFRR